MLSPSTTRRWRRRLGWPALLSTCWVVLYTGLVTFHVDLKSPEVSTMGYLLSSQHLSTTMGWLFLLALAFTFVGAVLETYVFLAGH